MSDLANRPAVNDALAARLAAQRARQQQRPNTDETPSRIRWQPLMRWLHVYASMIAFVVILFFGATGLLLNHPTWLWGDEEVTTIVEGTLPESVVVDDGRIEFLSVSEFFRSEHGVGGEVTNFDQIGDEGSINYTGPGYGASARFDVGDLSYRITVREEGFVNAMRDLHTGSDSGSAWSLVIDLSAVFLVVVAVTGLAIQLLMKKRRTTALAWMAAGLVASVAFMWLAMA